VIDANGAVDEAQAALGLIRAEAERRSELDDLVVQLERELYVLMAELATALPIAASWTPGVTMVTEECDRGRRRTDALVIATRCRPSSSSPTEPGAALCDYAVP